MLSPRCTKERGSIVRVANIVNQYVDFSSISVPAASLDFVAFDWRFDRLDVDNHFNYWVKDTIFEQLLRFHADCCCFINWHCTYVHADSSFVRSGLFTPVTDW